MADISVQSTGLQLHKYIFF